MATWSLHGGTKMLVDPITLEVFSNRFDAIAQEMQTTLLKSAYSIILKEGADASCALFSIDGQAIAQAAAQPLHLAALIPAVNRILEEFPTTQMQEGDIYCMNDPYDGGTHIPDLIVVAPIFYEGKPVVLGCSLAHQQDFGGKTPGSMVTDATEIFQEGLILPPVYLYQAGEINKTLERIIERNVRIPHQVLGDIMAQVAAGKTAGRRTIELIQRYSSPIFFQAIQLLLDHAEILTRKEIEKIPEGIYGFHDFIDNDGVELDRRIKIQVKVHVRGSSMHIDFEGTDPQVRGPANTSPTGVLGPVYYVIRAVTDPSIPNNSGCYRPVTVNVPEGTILNPRRPAPVSIRSHTLKRVVDTLLGALAQAIPEKICAASHGSILAMSVGGIDPDTHEPYVYMEANAGGTGAVLGKDGVDNLDTDLVNARNIPAEAAELEYPIRVWRNNLRIDSGGAGHNRGGSGTERIIELLTGEAVVSHRNDRHFTAPWGLFGGGPGAKWKTVVERGEGDSFEVPARMIFQLREGDRIHAYTGGGGGYGDPLTRDPVKVLDDVLDRKLSTIAARELYGVVVDEAGMTVDVLASEALRAQLKETRGPVAWVYDRGNDLGREGRMDLGG